METTKTSISWWINEQIVFDSHHGTLLSNEKGQATDKCNNIGKFQKRYAEQKELDIKIAHYVILFIWNFIWSNL